MKKLYSTIMLLATMVAALSFTACGGDDGSDTPSVIGTWKVTKFSILESGKTEEITNQDIYLTITDKTFSIFDKRTNTSETENYTLNGNILRVSNDQYIITELTSSSMVLTMQVQTLGSQSTYDVTIYLQKVSNDASIPGSDISTNSTSLVIVRYSGERYTTREGLEWTGADPNGNLTDDGSIFCWMVKENTLSTIYFRINLTKGEKAVRDFPVGYNLGTPTVNFGLTPGSDNKYKYGSGSLIVISNNGKGFTLKFDNYWATRTSTSSIIINGTLYVEKERLF